MKKLHPHLLFSVFLAIILLLAGCQIFQDKQNEDAAPQEKNETEHPIEETENPNTNTEEDPNQNGTLQMRRKKRKKTMMSMSQFLQLFIQQITMKKR